MIRAALSRIAELAFVALGVSVLTFLMIHLIPGDAAQVMLGADDVGAVEVAALRAKLGLDRALPVQFVIWLGAALQGDFGTSIWTGRPVVEEILGAFGHRSVKATSGAEALTRLQGETFDVVLMDIHMPVTQTDFSNPIP